MEAFEFQSPWEKFPLNPEKHPRYTNESSLMPNSIRSTPKRITKSWGTFDTQITVYALCQDLYTIFADLQAWESENHVAFDRSPARLPSSSARRDVGRSKGKQPADPLPDENQQAQGLPHYLWVIPKSLTGNGHLLIWSVSPMRIQYGDLAQLYFGVTSPSGLTNAEHDMSFGAPGSASCRVDIQEWVFDACYKRNILRFRDEFDKTALSERSAEGLERGSQRKLENLCTAMVGNEINFTRERVTNEKYNLGSTFIANARCKVVTCRLTRLLEAAKGRGTRENYLLDSFNLVE